MKIVYDEEDLSLYMRDAVQVSRESPVLLDRFLEDAVEVDVDCVSDGDAVFIAGVMEHIEQAGIHSGDSACSLPPAHLDHDVRARLGEQTRGAREGARRGRALMNVQYAIKDGSIHVLEVNPRASRTVPFVSKAIGVPLAKAAALCMVGRTLAELGLDRERRVDHYAVKEAVFPFVKLPGGRFAARPGNAVDRGGDGLSDARSAKHSPRRCWRPETSCRHAAWSS